MDVSQDTIICPVREHQTTVVRIHDQLASKVQPSDIIHKDRVQHCPRKLQGKFDHFLPKKWHLLSSFIDQIISNYQRNPKSNTCL